MNEMSGSRELILNYSITSVSQKHLCGQTEFSSCFTPLALFH